MGNLSIWKNNAHLSNSISHHSYSYRQWANKHIMIYICS